MKPLIAVVSLLALASSGCVSRMTIRDEPRAGVAFEDVATAQTFYDAYLRMCHSESGHFTIALRAPYHHVKRGSENAQFNAAVDQADVDRDRNISRAEARAYAVAAGRVHGGSLQVERRARGGQTAAAGAKSAIAHAAP